MINVSNVFADKLRQAVKASAIEVQEEARAVHRYKQGNGQLKNSVDMELIGNGLTARVFLNTNVAPYGPFVHEGTKAHLINPRYKKSLRWASNGAFYFSKKVKHPGTKADPFLYDAMENKQDAIKEIFAKYTEKGVEEIADSIRGTTYIYR